MTDSVDIHLPCALWLAKLTPSTDPAELFLQTESFAPSNWFPTPLSTGIDFGGVLSLEDVGHGIEPNLSPVGSLPLPGDRIILTRTGRRVEAFGALEITGVTATPQGGIRIGHRPLIQLDRPVDLRQVRTTNQLLDNRWDHLFGTGARNRRLIPLVDQDVALCFTAMGISLEALFASFGSESYEPRFVSPIEPWDLGYQVEHISITTDYSIGRIADSVAAFHGVFNALETDPSLASVEVSAITPGCDLLLSMQRPDQTYFTIAQSLCSGSSFQFSAAYRHLMNEAAAVVLVAVETDEEWLLVEMGPSEWEALEPMQPDLVDAVLRQRGIAGE